MSRYVLHRRHEPRERGAGLGAFKGHPSALLHQPTLASCAFGGHAIWWAVEATSEQQALGQLPLHLAERSTATPVSPVEIPQPPSEPFEEQRFQ